MELKELIDLSNKAFQENNFQKVIELLKKVILLQPNRYEIYFRLGLASNNLGNLKDAISYFEKAVLINPNSAPTLCNLGNLYAELNEKNLALKNYFKSIEIDSKNFKANYNLGSYYFKLGNLEEAEKYLVYAKNIMPNNIYTYNSLLLLYDRSNNLKKLEKNLMQAKNFFPESSLVKFFEGIIQYRKKNYQQSINILSKLELNKNDKSRVMLKENYLAKSYDSLGLYQEAYNSFEISNTISKQIGEKIFNKKKFLNSIHNRINYFSNFIPEITSEKKNKKNNSDPVFLIGFPRSGTTLLDTILRTHNLIEVIEEKPLVDTVIKEIENNMNYSFATLEKLDDLKINELRQLYFKKMEQYLEISPDKIYVDKFPLNIIYLAEINKIFPEAKYILALRNPRDSVLSCFMQSFTPNDAMLNMLTIDDASNLYDQTMQLWKIYEKVLDIKFHKVKYEDVVNNFEPTIKDLITFLELDWTDKLKDFYKTAEKKRIISTPSYDQVNNPIYNKSIGRWKNYKDKFINTGKIFEKWNKEFNY